MIYVIGSGPAGISAAVTLVQAGLPVTLLDGGITLELEKQEKLLKLRAQDKSTWDKTFIQSFKDNLVSDQKGLQKKLSYGSDFPYAEVDAFIPVEGHNIGQLSPTLAQGGFSTVWGSAVLPYSPADLASWPIGVEELAPHYRSVLNFLPLTAARDALETTFPLYTEKLQRLRPSKQAESLFAAAGRSEEHLQAAQLICGAPRLAVSGNECVYCGLCLFGCPKCIIYSTQSTLESLRAHSNFTYRAQVVVKRVQDTASGVTVDAVDRLSGAPLKFEGDAVFLGAGVLSTAKILFESFPKDLSARELAVSEYFLLPLLHSQKTKKVGEEELHALAQLFLECFDPEISAHSVHMQLYTYSELYERALTKMLRLLGPMRNIVKDLMLSRLLAIQGYLHSDDSSRIKLSYRDSRLVMEGLVNPKAKGNIKKLTRKLFRHRKHLGFTPLIPMLQIGLPGEGRHAGGSFPMKNSPNAGDTDIFGRFCPSKNIYLVDASVFPTVPASTITFTAMANAQRIASAYLARSRGGV